MYNIWILEKYVHLFKFYSLTLCFMNFILRLFLRYSLWQALFVYRLIVATLIGKFFDDPFLFQNWNLVQMSFVDDGMKQRVNI